MGESDRERDERKARGGQQPDPDIETAKHRESEHLDTPDTPSDRQKPRPADTPTD